MINMPEKIMAAILIVVTLVFVALALAMKDSRTLEARKQYKERLFALKAGIADVERHIDRICNPETQEADAKGELAQHDCGCTPEKREEVCKAARELLNEAKVACEHAGDHKIQDLKDEQLEEVVKQIDAAALKVSQARRILVNKPDEKQCEDKDR